MVLPKYLEINHYKIIIEGIRNEMLFCNSEISLDYYSKYKQEGRRGVLRKK